VRAPTRPHPEILTTALPPPFFENQLAATKLVDASLDQARMPALAPTAVGLSPLASAAVISSAMDSAAAAAATESAAAAGGGGGGGDDGVSAGVAQSMGMPAMPAAGADTAAGFGGLGDDDDDDDIQGLVDEYDADIGDLVPAGGGAGGGAAAVPDYTDVGVGGVAGVPDAISDTEMGAAGGMPGDLKAVVNAPAPPAGAAGEVMGGAGGGGGAAGGGRGAGVPSGGDFADDIGGTNVEAVKEVPPGVEQELAPAGVEEEAAA